MPGNMRQHAISASSKLMMSAILAAVAFVVLVAVCRLRNCTCSTRWIDSIVLNDTRTGHMVVNAVTGALYVDAPDSMDIAVFDAAHWDRGPLARVPTEGYIGGLALDEVANKLYVVQGFAGRVRVIDGATHAYHDFAVPDLVNAMSAVAVDPTRKRLFVARADNHDIAVFDTTTEAFVASIDEGCCASTSIVLAVDPSTGYLYVLNQTPPQVTVFDAEQRKIAVVAVGDVPAFIALDPTARRAYVTNSTSLYISVIDIAPGHPRAFHVIEDIKMREHPTHIAIDATARRAYVTNNGTDTMAIIDLDRSRWVEDIELGYQPLFIALDPATSRLVASADISKVEVIQGCRAPGWSWDAVRDRPTAAIATPPPLRDPTAVAQRRLSVRCNRMFRIRTQCSEGSGVYEAKLAHAEVESAGARVADGGAAGQICGVDADYVETDLAAAGLYYSVPVIELGASTPVVWTFHSASRTFGGKTPPPGTAVTRVETPPEAPWAEALWYLSRYKTKQAPEAVAGCE